jgi:hypothetical protein
MPKLERFTPSQQRNVEALVNRWSELISCTDRIGKKDVRKAVDAVYAQMGKSPPLIVTLRSPFQLGIVPDLLRHIPPPQVGNFATRLQMGLKRLQAERVILPLEPLAQLEQEILKQGKIDGWHSFDQLRLDLLASKLTEHSDNRIFMLGQSADDDWRHALNDHLQGKVLALLRTPRWALADMVRVQIVEDVDPLTVEEARSSTVAAARRVQMILQGQARATDPQREKLRAQELWAKEGTRRPGRVARDTLFLWQHARRLALIDFCANVLGSDFDNIALPWLLLGSTVHGCLRFDEVCFVCDRPTKFLLDEQERLHADQGPAVEYADGYSIYAWHGVLIGASKKHIVDEPRKITTAQIDRESNITVRRVMMERFGIARYVQESNARVIDRDLDPLLGHERILYRKDLDMDEPIMMLAVTNSTPEPDGSHKQYFIRVPREMRTAQEAVAWTFGMSADEYRPTRQS